MTLNYLENISNTYNDQHELILNRVSVVEVIYADTGKVLKNKITGKLCGDHLIVGVRDSKDNYEEVEVEVDK